MKPLAGTAIWHLLLSSPGATLSESFYFAVVTFLTIGYGDLHPVSKAAKVFFIVYVVLSLIVHFTVLSCFLSNSLTLQGLGGEDAEQRSRVRPSAVFKSSTFTDQTGH
jgi:hypothetical protein